LRIFLVVPKPFCIFAAEYQNAVMNGYNSERLSQESECHQDRESGILERASAFARRVLEEIEALTGTTTCKSVQLVKLRKWAEKGITAGFKSAKKQGCKIVVIDLDEHIWQVRPFELSKYIARRRADFVSGMMEACYVVYNGEAVVVNAMEQTRKEIEFIINELKP
jgi:hypothetical protein